MLSERRAQGLHYDAPTDTSTLSVGPATSPSRDSAVAVSLLLDAGGFLVGVDIGSGALDRRVVMLGRHEDVATTRAGKVTVTHGADGEISRIAIGAARETIRGAEKNPYLG